MSRDLANQAINRLQPAAKILEAINWGRSLGSIAKLYNLAIHIVYTQARAQTNKRMPHVICFFLGELWLYSTLLEEISCLELLS